MSHCSAKLLSLSAAFLESVNALKGKAARNECWSHLCVSLVSLSLFILARKVLIELALIPSSGLKKIPYVVFLVVLAESWHATS